MADLQVAASLAKRNEVGDIEFHGGIGVEWNDMVHLDTLQCPTSCTSWVLKFVMLAQGGPLWRTSFTAEDLYYCALWRLRCRTARQG